MKEFTEKQTIRRLTRLPNAASVQLLKSTVARLHNLEMDMNELEFALDEDQKEIESYTREIDECLDRIKDIDEFVYALESNSVPDVTDVASTMASMTEERDEEENAIKQLEEVRGWHEQQFQRLQGEWAALKKERIELHKTCLEICFYFSTQWCFRADTAKTRQACFQGVITNHATQEKSSIDVELS
ncbi:unnamed protein product [Phytophthora lilii]|uniref:Unnamed protein product n=1 Tax=Phytophthora lilii TaxID=2077276 RepID=A0A9W6TYW9_9STRA|nr:unnamed protein product [Phytophthora lilii]